MRDYENVVMATLLTPGCQVGSHRADAAISGVEHGQSDDKESEATLVGKVVAPSLPQDGSDKVFQECKLGRCYSLAASIDEYSIFYIGGESRALSNVIISYQSCQVQ